MQIGYQNLNSYNAQILSSVYKDNDSVGKHGVMLVVSLIYSDNKSN